MARRTKSGVNKSEEVRGYLRDHKKAKPREIVAALKEKGITVTANFASNIKSTMKRKKRASGRSEAAVAATNGAAGHDVLAVAKLLKAAQVFAQQAGGVKQAKQALDAAGTLA